MTRHVNTTTLAKIKRWEGFRAHTYDDFQPDRAFNEGETVLGTLTIGYGHTGPHAYAGHRITLDEGEAILRDDLARFERGVDNAVMVELTDHQFGALVSFAFNVGLGAFRRSTLLRKLNAGDYDAVPAELMKWVHSKGRRLEGLANRRAAEVGLWSTGELVSSRHVQPKPPQSDAVLNTAKIGGGVAGGGAAIGAVTEAMDGLQGTSSFFSSDNPMLWVLGTVIVLGIAYVAWRKWGDQS